MSISQERYLHILLVVSVSFVLLLLSPLKVFAIERGKQGQQMITPTVQNYTNRLIIKFKDSRSTVTSQTISALKKLAGVSLSYVRAMSGNSHVFSLQSRKPVSEVEQIAVAIRQNSSIAYAEPDIILTATRTPNDPRYGEQWHYFNPVSGINLPLAWDITQGSSDVIIAVVDTGIVPHADLVGRVPSGSGYDFITDSNFAKDGNGRDSDPSDPGNWVTQQESQDT